MDVKIYKNSILIYFMYSRERNGMVSLRYVAEKTREQTTTAITDEEEVELAETENNFQFFCVLFFQFTATRKNKNEASENSWNFLKQLLYIHFQFHVVVVAGCCVYHSRRSFS